MSEKNYFEIIIDWNKLPATLLEENPFTKIKYTKRISVREVLKLKSQGLKTFKGSVDWCWCSAKCRMSVIGLLIHAKNYLINNHPIVLTINTDTI